MSLRDYFAGRAMQGLLSAESENISFKHDAVVEKYGGKTRQQKVAEEAWRQADAMLATRKVPA